jgi:hypothetical protein
MFYLYYFNIILEYYLISIFICNIKLILTFKIYFKNVKNNYINLINFIFIIYKLFHL